jgi:hypothetical protein
LAAADVPLTIGRKTVAVEVLGLIYDWATRSVDAPRRDRAWNSMHYEFARTVIKAYHANPRSRNSA